MLACGAEEAIACRQPAVRSLESQSATPANGASFAGQHPLPEIGLLGDSELERLVVRQGVPEHVSEHIHVSSTEGAEEHLRLERDAARLKDVNPGPKVMLSGIDERAVEVPEHSSWLVRHPFLQRLIPIVWPPPVQGPTLRKVDMKRSADNTRVTRRRDFR